MYTVEKNGVRITVIDNVIDVADNPMDVNIATAGNINYGDIGVDDPALDLRRPEITKITEVEVISGHYTGDSSQLFVKDGAKLKYVITVDDKNNMTIDFCKFIFKITTRKDEVSNNDPMLLNDNSDCLKALSVNSSGEETDSVSYEFSHSP